MVDEKSTNSVKLVASSKADPGSIVFTSSGTFIVPKGVKEIECFLVGGGGEGGSGGGNNRGGGGGGGYGGNGGNGAYKIY